jgi:hypothetical protein
VKRYILFILSLSFVSALAEEDHLCKHSIKCSMVHIYEETVPEVTSISDMFTQGMYYGRLRSNSFGFKWKNEISAVRKDHAVVGIGASLTYKSAYLHGFSVGVGLYGTLAKGNLSANEAYLYRSGKDTFSRYDLLNNGNKGFGVFAEGYLEYKYNQSSFKLGRQVFESFLTKSNDTKMIPNTFEGVTLHSKVIPDTSVKLAYLTKQKLRDHSKFHHLLAFGNNANNTYDFYNQNDDSAMHIGLTTSKLNARGIEDRLIIFEMMNRSIENLALRINYTTVPKLVSSAMIQADYRFDVEEWSVIPALRYMQQFDDGAGEIAGANLKTLTSGYSQPDSLDSALYGARIDMVNDAFKMRIAYTQVADKGDIIAPWRGFPTGGFTRAMGQYNWYANTKSYMFQLDYEFESMDDLKLISRFVVQDFDDNKIGVQADSNVFTLDLAKKLVDNRLYLKTRYGHVVGKNNTISSSGLVKLNPSYDEIRFEINYLF